MSEWTRWTRERTDALRRLWAEGHTASYIADALGGVSRNALLGKIHRLGLSGRDKAEKAVAKRRASKPRGGKQQAPHLTRLPRKGFTALVPLPVPDTDTLKPLRTIMTVRAGECRAIHGDPLADEPAMCGREVIDPAEPWCEAHAARFAPHLLRNRKAA